MLHNRPRVAGLLVLFAALVLAPSASAAQSGKAAAGATAKERAYGKHCGAKAKGAARKAQRGKCIEAMAKLATGKSSSPSKACRGLSRKKAKGERKSPYAACVSAGAKLLKGRKGKRPADNADDDLGSVHDGLGDLDEPAGDDGDGAGDSGDDDLGEAPADDGAPDPDEAPDPDDDPRA